MGIKKLKVGKFFKFLSFIHLFIHLFILPLTRNTTTVYRNTLKIIYNIPIKLFTRLNVVKARKPYRSRGFINYRHPGTIG